MITRGAERHHERQVLDEKEMSITEALENAKQGLTALTTRLIARKAEVKRVYDLFF